ncbi:hypothetical protein Rumeso_04642 [Rubellimicrobium mesophilum DSM 19309]|uniref:Uncharacterized protein n=1 Tax=Rubellimicrobium mesophilum DSM 19309 TaxID=442562 RepID=A0A017HGR0_9RHOB|nr:hypothetical protein Rumeso_04642 [Rubellimicrobium mesophilum DSM 19309]
MHGLPTGGAGQQERGRAPQPQAREKSVHHGVCSPWCLVQVSGEVTRRVRRNQTYG